MPPPDATQRSRRRSRHLLLPSRAWRSGLVFAAVALILAIGMDYWRNEALEAEAAVRIQNRMSPYADALRGAVERRLGLLAGLRSFGESRRTRATLTEEFPLFAQGTLSGTIGVRALQFVEDGRIVSTWPLVGNEAALNYDLLADPRPPIAADVRRALESGLITVTGPITLVQGGTGLLMRQRMTPRAGFPQLAAIILDVPALIAEAGVPDPRSGLRLEVRNRAMEWFGGDAEGSAVRPESLTISVVDGDWTLIGAPAEGWSAMMWDLRLPYRQLLGALVLLAGMLGLLVGGREERLRQEVEVRGTRLDLALRAGRMGVWEWDLASNKVLCSETVASILGFDPAGETDPARRFFEAVHPEDRPALESTLRATRAGERVSNVLECRVVHPGGRQRWILSISEAERDAAGKPAKIFGVLSDATDRHELEERLRHSQRLEAVGTLAGGISHDFNNLLTAMIGFGELAHDQAERMGDDPRAESIRDDIAQVLATANRAATLTGQLLAFSRRGVTLPSRMDVNALVRELEPMLGRLLSADLRLRTELAADVPAVWVDGGQLTQVLLNLAVNARDAMPSGGTIWVRTSHLLASGVGRPTDAPAGEWVVIEVEDNGMGIPAELQGRVFEPYFTTKEIGRGTGLGLAVVHGAIEQAGGVVTVRSAAGEGTLFSVYLPVRMPDTLLLVATPSLPRDRTAP